MNIRFLAATSAPHHARPHQGVFKFQFWNAKRRAFCRTGLSIAGLVACIGFSTECTQAAPVTAKRGDDFVNSLGINAAYQNPAVNFSAMKQKLQELGVRYVRTDTAGPDSARPTLVQRARDLGAVGIRSNLIFESRKYNGLYNTDTHTPSEVVQLLKDIGPQFCLAEGPNEPEHSSPAHLFSYNGYDWPDTRGIRDFQIALFNAIKGDMATRNVPMLPASLIGAYPGLDLSAYLDYGNMHTYAKGDTPLNGFSNDLSGAQTISGSKPMIATETGYQTAIPTTRGRETGDKPVTELVQAKYLTRTHFLFWNRNVARTHLYQLMDDPEPDGVNAVQANWGIVRADGTSKPAFNAIKSIVTLLGDATFNATTQQWVPNTVNAGSLDYSLSGDTANIEQTLLYRSNNKFYLVLFQNAQSQQIFAYPNSTSYIDQYGQVWDASLPVNVPNRALTLNLGTSISSARSFLPVTNGTTAINLAINGNMGSQSISLSVPDHPIIIELTPAASGPMSGQVYELEPQCAPGKRLDVAGAGNANGTNVHIWQDLDAPNQRWRFEDAGNGYFELIPQHATGQRLEVSGNNNGGAGANVQTWQDLNESDQRWKFEPVGNGYYEVIPAHNAGLRLDVMGAGNANGTDVKLWSDLNNSAQRWRLIP